MTSSLKQRLALVPLCAAFVLTWPQVRAHAGEVTDSQEAMRAASEQKAVHMQDGEAFHSTLLILVVVVVLGVLASLYFIRKDKEEDKDLEQ